MPNRVVASTGDSSEIVSTVSARMPRSCSMRPIRTPSIHTMGLGSGLLSVRAPRRRSQDGRNRSMAWWALVNASPSSSIRVMSPPVRIGVSGRMPWEQAKKLTKAPPTSIGRARRLHDQRAWPVRASTMPGGDPPPGIFEIMACTPTSRSPTFWSRNRLVRDPVCLPPGVGGHGQRTRSGLDTDHVGAAERGRPPVDQL